MKRLIILAFIISFVCVLFDITKLFGAESPIIYLYKNVRDTSQPGFPGGSKAWYKFLAANLKWPNGFDGQSRVTIGFFVETDGRLTNIAITKSGGTDCDAEALRVIKKSPKWIPAMSNGKPVRIKYAVPINFTLSG